MPNRRPLTIGLTEASAAVADIGVLLPIAAALVLVNGVDAGAALGFAGLLFVVAGLVYRVPMPVQPIKAAAAIAIATKAPPAMLAAAGIGLGAILLVLALTRLVPLAAKLFPTTIIRGNQLGVGILLLFAAYQLVDGSDQIGLAVAAAIAATVAALPRARGPVALALVAGGIGWTMLQGGTVALGADPTLPSLAIPSWGTIVTAMTLLVIPQLPLTFGNAIVGTADLEHEYYGARARRVTPTNLALSCGLANVTLGMFGGMPLCHGSSGATAYHRFGARTGGVNLVIGGALLAAGLVFAPAALTLFGMIPPAVLAGLLAYTGLEHGLLVADQRGPSMAIAVAMGVIGGATRNLAIGMAVGLPAYAAVALAGRARAALGGAR
ncbi:MAG TPA: putative sulfate/molybdate transporter [Actinomycetota bacterium]